MIKSFCVVLVTKNLEQQLTFYKDIIGLEEFFNQDNTIGLGYDNRLHIVLRAEYNPNSHHQQENKGPIIITFQVEEESKDLIMSRLVKEGHTIRDTLALPQYDSEYIFIEDVDGNELCLDVKREGSTYI